MSFAEDLFSYFTTRPALNALVDERVYPVKLPQGPTLPAITYQQVSDAPEYSHDAYASSSPRIQFTVWAESFIEGEAIAKQVKVEAGAWHGVMRGAAFVENSVDLGEPVTKIYQVAIDVMFYGVAL